LEIQDRAALATRSLTPRLAAAWAWRWAALAFAASIALAAVLVAAQPIRAPWWTYADADATYAAAALNVVAGYDAQFVDHPGLPVTEAAAIVFGAEALARGNLRRAERETFTDATLLDLDRARAGFRGLAIALYLAGAAMSFLLAVWLFGHWSAGAAGSLFWIGAPGLMPMSIQLRPDVLLGVCCVAFAYVLGRAAETRSASLYAAAAAIAGVALMVKLHAIGLVLPLLVAVLWRPPAVPWRPGSRTLWAGAGLLVLAFALNLERFPYTPTAAQAAVGAAIVGLLAAATIAAFAVPRLSARAAIAVAYLVGVLVPVVLVLPDGLQALVLLAKAAVGRGVSDVPAFETPALDGLTLGGSAPVVVFVGALAAAALAFARREPAPVLWAAGAVALLTLAWARPVVSHYLAPGYLLAVPAVVWLVRQLPRPAPLLVVPLALVAAWGPLRDRDQPAIDTSRLQAQGEQVRASALTRLEPGEVAAAPSYFPDPDVRYFELVQLYVAHSPKYPYRLLPATDAAERYARDAGLRLSIAVGGAELP
jgi:Dolichyl-phosphate-mannose-protein mannosyltransferase